MATAPILLERIFEPVADILTPEAAQRIIDWQVDNETQSRLDELADRCNEGKLTPEEMAEYDRYLAAFDLVAIIQSQARDVLNQADQI